MLFKTTIKMNDYTFASTVEAESQQDAAAKAVVSYYGDNALFVPSGEQPICGWVGPVYRLPIGSGKVHKSVIVKVMKMKKIEEAAVVGKIGKKFFDEEMKSKGITPTKGSRALYKLKESIRLKGTVLSNIKEVHIRRWFDKTYGNSYYSLRLVASLDNTKYEMNIPSRYGYGESHSLLRQSGVVTDDLLVRKWLEYNDIVVVDEGYGRKSDMYKSAI